MQGSRYRDFGSGNIESFGGAVSGDGGRHRYLSLHLDPRGKRYRYVERAGSRAHEPESTSRRGMETPTGVLRSTNRTCDLSGAVPTPESKHGVVMDLHEAKQAHATREEDAARVRFSHLASCREDVALQSAVDALAPFPDGLGRHVLLVGPPGCGKTSMLFHCARSLAEAGQVVLLLLVRRRVEARPPHLPPGASPSDACYGLVHVKYVDGGRDLRSFLACAHLCEVHPSAVLVDDLSWHVENDVPSAIGQARGRESRLTRLLAELREASEVFGSRAGRPCVLVATERGGEEGPPLRYIYERWFPLVLCATPRGGGRHDLFQLPRAHGESHCASLRYVHLDEEFRLERVLAAPARETPTKRPRGRT